MRVSLAIADTYLEDGLGSVSAVLRARWYDSSGS